MWDIDAISFFFLFAGHWRMIMAPCDFVVTPDCYNRQFGLEFREKKEKLTFGQVNSHHFLWKMILNLKLNSRITSKKYILQLDKTRKKIRKWMAENTQHFTLWKQLKKSKRALHTLTYLRLYFVYYCLKFDVDSERNFGTFIEIYSDFSSSFKTSKCSTLWHATNEFFQITVFFDLTKLRALLYVFTLYSLTILW